MVHKLVDPGEKQVRLVSPVALQRRTGFCLVLLQTTAIVGDLCRGECGYREVVAVAVVGVDRGAGKLLGHRTPPLLDWNIINMLPTRQGQWWPCRAPPRQGHE